jgi:kinesin family protein 5
MSTGNIRVFCRLRPENKVERESGGHCCVEYTRTNLKLRTSSERSKGEEVHEFAFDYVGGPETSQAEVFQLAASPVVTGVLTGYNGTLFAYGQTGSGKTHTMEGPSISDQQMKGIIPRMMDALFVGLVNASTATEFSIKVSFLEIYMERIQDLLDESKSNLQVKEDKARGIYIHDATEVYVSSPAEMQAVMQTGSQNRSVASTRMNEKSSRSHSIFIVHVEQKDIDSGSRRSGKLHFVDLAGSEKIGKTQVSGQQLEEAKMINKSLSALGMVINALTERQAFVPYRDSKLTRLLQESLGGNSQTTLVIACSMSSYNDFETLSTLRFGQRAKKIQNKPIVNQERSAKELLVKLEQAEREIQKQAEIINSIQSHIAGKYANHPSLPSEISCIISSSLTVQRGSETPEVIHERPVLLAEANSAQSLMVLKQHIEIVNLSEELQKIRLEKKELEDELGFRSREENRLMVQIADLEREVQGRAENSQKREQELETILEKALQESQQKNFDISKIRNSVLRLKADMALVQRDLGGLSYPGIDILKESIAEALAAFSEKDAVFSKGISLSLDFRGEEIQQPNWTRVHHKSMPELPAILGADSSPQRMETESSIKSDHSQAFTEDLNSKFAVLQEKYQRKKEKAKELSTFVSELKHELTRAQETAVASKADLQSALQAIESERRDIAAESKMRDRQIIELQHALNQEREKFEDMITMHDPRHKILQTEERVADLLTERKKVLSI